MVVMLKITTTTAGRSWGKAVEGIKLLMGTGFRVYLSTTETPINTHRLEAVCEFHRSLGIPDQDRFRETFSPAWLF